MANREQVEMVMTLIDDVSPHLKKIKDEINKLATETDKPIGQKANTGLKGLLGSLGDFQKLAISFVGIKAVQVIGEIGKKALMAASDMAELENVTSQVFGNLSDEVEEFAKRTGEEVGRSTYAIKKYVSEMGAILKGFGGFEDEKIKEMSESLSVLAVDMASFKNVSDEQTFTALRGAITGETEALKTLGVVINDTVMAEYARSQGYKDSWSNLDINTKAELRYQKILESTKFMQGDAARTIDSFSNQLKVASANFSNLAVVIGDKFMPAANGVIGAFNNILKGLNDFLSKKSATDYINDFVTKTSELTSLSQRYIELSKTKVESGLSNEKEEERLALYNELINKYPDLKDRISKEAEEWGKVNDAIKDIIDSLKQKTLAQARADFIDSIKEKTDKANKEIGKKQIEYNEGVTKAQIKTGVSSETFNSLANSEKFNKFLLSNSTNTGLSDRISGQDILNAIKADEAFKNASLEEQKKIEQNYQAIFEETRKLNSLKGAIQITESQLRRDIESASKTHNETIEKLNSALNNEIAVSGSEMIYTIAENAKISINEINNAISIAETNIWDSAGEIKQEVIDSKFALLSALKNYIAVFNGKDKDISITKNEDGSVTKTTKDKKGNLINTSTFKGTNAEEEAKKSVQEDIKKGLIGVIKDIPKPTPNKPPRVYEGNRGGGGKKRGNSGSSKTKEKDKWESLEESLSKVNKELNNLVLSDKRFASIRELTNKIREKQEQNVDKLLKSELITPVEAINEKIKLSEESIKTLSEIFVATKNDKLKDDLSVKIKNLKNSVKELKYVSKEKSLIDKLKDEIDELNFELKQDENKADFIDKNKERTETKFKKTDKKYSLGTVTLNEAINEKIAILKQEIDELVGVNSDEARARIEELQKATSAYNHDINLNELNENIKQYKQGLLTRNELLSKRQEYLNKEIELSIKTNDLEKALNLKKQRILLELEKVSNANRENELDNKIFNNMKSSIEKLGKENIELLKIDETKQIHDNHLKELQSAISQLPKELKERFEGIDFNKPFEEIKNSLTIDLSDEDNKLMTAILSMFSEAQKTFKEVEEATKLEKEKQKIKDISENIKMGIDNVSKLAKSLGDEDLNNLVDNISQVFTDLTSGISSFMTGDIKGAINSAISVLSSAISNIFGNSGVKEREKAEKDYKARQKELDDNTRALRELKDTLKSATDNILKATSANTSDSNIEFNKKYTQLLNETYARSFNPKILMNGVAERTFSGLLGGLFNVVTLGLFNNKKENVEYTKNFSELFNVDGKNSKELEKIYEDNIKNLNNDNLSKFLDKQNGVITEWNLKDVSSNLDEIKAAFLNKIQYLKEAEKAQDDFKNNAILESFDGVSVVDKNAKKKEMLENLKNLAKDREDIEKLIPEFEKKIDELLANQDLIITAFDDTRNSIIDGISKGTNIIDVMAGSLQTYFNKLRNNIAKVKYDLEFREMDGFEEKFSNKFKAISKALLDIRTSSNKTIKDLDPKELDFKDLFKQLKNMSKVSNDMEDIVKELRKQAKAEGLSDEIIEQMLPLDKITSKVSVVADAMKKAMSAALDTNSFNQFSMSLGESIYQSFKENILKAFVDSAKYQELYSKYFDNEEYKVELSKANTIKDAYDTIQNQLSKFENILKSEGLGFRETNAVTGEYLGGISAKSNDVSKSTLYQNNPNITLNSYLYNYGFVAVEDFTKGLFERFREEEKRRKEKEV